MRAISGSSSFYLHLEYPFWSSWFLRPFATLFEEGVGEDDELSHDGGDGDLGGFSGFDQLLVFRLHVDVQARGDEGRHVEGLA